MFAIIYIALASFFMATITAASPARHDLSLCVSGPHIFDGAENVKVVANITNTGDVALNLVNDPESPLNRIPANKFDVSDAAGRQPLFIGSKSNFIPYDAAVIGKEGDFTVLRPGESIVVEHDLSKAYNFTHTGSGLYTIEARSLFYHVESSTADIVSIYARTVAHEALISMGMAAGNQSPAPTTELKKRSEYYYCTTEQEYILIAAAAAAQLLVTNALQYMYQEYTPAALRYRKWFGSYHPLRWNRVRLHFANMNSRQFSSYDFNCSCTTDGSHPTWAAYVNNAFPGLINICPRYWPRPLSGTATKAGALVHEVSHFTAIARTGDWARGKSACEVLALTDPDRATFNADSHEFFAENYPAYN